MRMLIFVLKDNKVAFWEFSRGQLLRRTLKGNCWNSYSTDFWNDWSKVNQPKELEDAILLSDCLDGFGSLPKWLHYTDGQMSGWTIQILSKLTKDSEFVEKGKRVEFHQHEQKYVLSRGLSDIVCFLSSSLKFNLPKETPKPKPQPVPKKPDVIGDSCNDPKALKLSIGDKVTGWVEAILKTLNRYYIKADGLTDQVCFKPDSKQTFSVGDKVTLCMTSIDKIEKKVFFSITKN